MRRRRLRDAGLATVELDREIVEVRRQLREGGQLRAGDALDDGRYLLVQEVGRGGFAVVWDAYDRTEEQHVAIKVLHANLAGDPLRRERFFRGARAMRDLAHPAVVRVLEPEGEDEGFHYFVMELLAGGNLRQAVLANRVANERAVPLLLRVIEAVASAHARSMVHRDIKPANILLDDEGNPKLTDFDLVGAADTTGGTRTGAMGTVVYAAPECLDKPQEATARADVYGLGMTALFCLSGQELSLSVFRDPEPLIARLGCSDPIKDVLRRAVEWKPDDRFADAAALGHALREALAPPRLEHEGADLLVTSPGPDPVAGGAAPVFAPAAKPPDRKGGIELADEPRRSALAWPVGSPPYTRPTAEPRAGTPAWIPAKFQLRSIGLSPSKLSKAPVVSSPPRPSVPAAGSPVVAAPASSVLLSSDAAVPPVWREPVRRSQRRAVLAGGGAAAAFALVLVAYNAFRDDPSSRPIGRGVDPGGSARHPPDAAAVPEERQTGGAASNCPDEMVHVSAETFQMGSPDGKGDADEHPQHAVTLSGYCIDKTEVTVKAYAACVAAKECTAAPLTVKWSGYSEEEVKRWSRYCNRSDRPDHPMNCVDWDQATAYCKWAEKRLPTEAEWEYAARGNGGRDYPWGKDAPSEKLLNACGAECVTMAKRDLKLDWRSMYSASDGFETTAPVGSFREGASPFGALDMAGNVWEWIADWCGDYEAAPAPNPQGPKVGTSRVVRGGAWHLNDAGGVRAAHRNWDEPTNRYHYLGFRCARHDRRTRSGP